MNKPEAHLQAQPIKHPSESRPGPPAIGRKANIKNKNITDLWIILKW